MAKLGKYDRRHLSDLEALGRRIDTIFRTAAREATALAASISRIKPDALFSFDDYPITRKRIEELLQALRDSLSTAIVNGVRSGWTLANDKNNELSRFVFGDNVGKLTPEQYRRYFSTNGKALEAFIARKTNGLGLSDRVWRYSEQFKKEIEMALDIGIRDGLSADRMARELRSYLRYPDKLFRRVRDEHGNLVLSRAAKAFHPGQGVYRSSYKNARRLAATESNIAYRTSDYLRWQRLDFVVGIEIHLSNNHTLNGKPFHDICDELAGRYPKDFKFTGWHPLCRCFATTVLKSEEEMAEDNRRILAGESVSAESENTVKDVPKKFKEWVEDNSGRIARAKNPPYFIRDNQNIVDDILNLKQRKPTALEIAKQRHEKRTEEQIKSIQQKWDERRKSAVIPSELRSGGKYLKGDKYTFSADFFALVDPKRPIKLEILDADSGSYLTFSGNLVHIAGRKRGAASPWEAKAVIYHEYGHCIDAQRALWQDTKLIKMRKSQSEWLNGKCDKTLFKREWDQNKGGWIYSRKNMGSNVAYIDKRLELLAEKIYSMDESIFTKRGITKMDALEQIGSTRDTIKSLNVKYGAGHTTTYFKRTRMKETEYLAHAFENTFLGNRVFQKYLPAVYEEMVRYIKSLKPL